MKFFIHDIENDVHLGIKHNFFIYPNSTHYIMDNNGDVIYQGGVEGTEKKYNMLMDKVALYKIRKLIR